MSAGKYLLTLLFWRALFMALLIIATFLPAQYTIEVSNNPLAFIEILGLFEISQEAARLVCLVLVLVGIGIEYQAYSGGIPENYSFYRISMLSAFGLAVLSVWIMFGIGNSAYNSMLKIVLLLFWICISTSVVAILFYRYQAFGPKAIFGPLPQEKVRKLVKRSIAWISALVLFGPLVTYSVCTWVFPGDGESVVRIGGYLVKDWSDLLEPEFLIISAMVAVVLGILIALGIGRQVFLILNYIIWISIGSVANFFIVLLFHIYFLPFEVNEWTIWVMILGGVVLTVRFSPAYYEDRTISAGDIRLV